MGRCVEGEDRTRSVLFCHEFMLPCRRSKPFADGIVAIDGSKFKAVDNRDKNFTERKPQAGRRRLEDGYNVQTAVDARHPMIVVYGVTNA